MTRQWTLEKYARFVQNTPETESFCLQKSKENGTWQHFSRSPSCPIILTIEGPSNLMIRKGEMVFETFTLVQAAKCCKVIARNDSMLFFYKNKDSVRRFRIKFSSLGDNIPATQNCKDFIDALRSFIPVEAQDDGKSIQMNSTALESSQLLSQSYSLSETCTHENSSLTKSDPSLNELSVSNVTKSIMSNNISSMPPYYQSGNLQVEDSSATASLIKTCLLDPNFPSFVEEVEKHIYSLIGSS